MFDISKILKRSWNIVWQYRLLWVFGFILALTAGGAGSSNWFTYTFNNSDFQNYSYQPDWYFDELRGDTPGEVITDLFRQIGLELSALQRAFPTEFQMAVTLMVTVAVLAIIGAIIFTFLRYTAIASTIRMVDKYELSGVKVGFRKGWRYGWSSAGWRAFLIDLLLNLPLLLLGLAMALITWWIFAAIWDGVESVIVTRMVAGTGLGFLLIFLTVVVMVFFGIWRNFAWRISALEDHGVFASLGRAWRMIWRHWKNVGLMWLLMVGLGIAWAIAFFILLIPLLLVSVITMVFGALVAAVPMLIATALASLFSAPDFWPWIFGAMVAAPFFFIVGFAPILLVSGWWEIFQSSVWTLTYRELKAMEVMKAAPEVPAVEPPAVAVPPAVEPPPVPGA